MNVSIIHKIHSLFHFIFPFYLQNKMKINRLMPPIYLVIMTCLFFLQEVCQKVDLMFYK